MSDQMVIFGVSADPDPHEVNTIANGQRPVMQADSRGPELTDLLDLQRRVPRILKHLFVAAVGQFPCLGGQTVVAVPESWRRAMIHRGVQCPSWDSRRTSSANQSSRPPSTSASNCRSH